MNIGIVGKQFDKSIGCQVPYLNYFSTMGNVSIILPQSEIDESLDLVVLPGGPDVIDYSALGFFNNQPDLYYEWFDHNRLPQYIEAKVPVFGICRGLQAINNYYGGALYQELYNHNYSLKSRDELVHQVLVTEEWKWKLGTTQQVNSLHHQGINVLGTGLIVVATGHSNKWNYNNLPEAIIHESDKVAAVQWHPEEILDHLTPKLIELITDTEN